jgi:hypothetical protein
VWGKVAREEKSVKKNRLNANFQSRSQPCPILEQ